MRKHTDLILSFLPLLIMLGLVYMTIVIEPEQFTSAQEHIDHLNKVKLYGAIPMFIMWACLIYFLVKVVKDEHLSKIGKTFWFIFIGGFNVIALPAWGIYAKYRSI